MRQAKRILKDLEDLRAGNPSSASSNGQRKRVRFADLEHLDSHPDGDTDMQASGQEAAVTRKRAAETDFSTSGSESCRDCRD